MRRSFNKFGSIEIDGSTMRYRISVQQLGIEDPAILEKEIKRKINEVTLSNNFLLPFDIQVVNRYMILYYDLSHFASLDYLREITLKEKISYYLSLITLAKEHESGVSISWDRLNLIVDKHEKSLKVFLFETESLLVYDTTTDIMKTVKDLIVTTMTDLSIVLTMPRRNDFISPSEENIRFIEDLYQIENLDDLSMYLETISLDIKQQDSTELETGEISEKKKAVLFKRNPVKSEKVKPKREYVSKSTTNKRKKKANNNNTLLIVVGVVVVALVINFASPLFMPKSVSGNKNNAEQLKEENQNNVFSGSIENVDSLVEAYRYAYNSNYEEAYEHLSKIKRTELSQSDVPLLIKVHNETNNITTLLEEVPVVANDVIIYLLTQGKLNQITDISSSMEIKNPYIEFEKAHFNREFEYLITLIDQIDINGRREQQIVDAYLALEKVSDARTFAEKTGNPDLIKRVRESEN